MPEVVTTLPGGGGAKFLVRRRPFSERLMQGLAGAAETIGGGLFQRALDQQLQQQRREERGQEALTKLLPQIQTLISDKGLSPEAGRALIESVSTMHGVEPPDLDTSLFKRPEPTARERLQGLAPLALQGDLTPELVEAFAAFQGVEPGVATGLPPQSTGGAGAALTPLPGLESALGPAAGLPPAPPGVGPRRLDPIVQQLQELAMRGRAARTPEEEAFTLSPGEVRFRGKEEIARGLAKPAEEEDPFLQVGGALLSREDALRAMREGRAPTPLFTPPQQGPAPRINEQTVIGDVEMRGIPGMRPQFVGKPVRVQFRDGQPVRVLGQTPEDIDPLMQLLTGGGGAEALTPQPSHAPTAEEPGILDRAMSSISSFFGGGDEQQPSAAPDGAAEQLLRSQGVPVTPKNLELAREQLRRNQTGGQRVASPQVGSVVTLRDGTRGRVVAIRPDGRLEVEPAPSPDAGNVVTAAELRAIAARRGTTVEQERRRAIAEGFTVR